MLKMTTMPSINRIANPDYAPADHQKTTVAALTLGALGVVYGDIGTSPLYALKEVFSPSTGVLANPENVIGAVSVVLWALMLVVTLKYVLCAEST
jgi:KUP system potassium uptake protein